MSERFYMPSMSLMGAGCIEEVPAEIKELGLTKALIVTDKVLNQIGLVGELTNQVEETSNAMFATKGKATCMMRVITACVREKSGAAHAAPPIPYGYSIARICSIRDCFFA